MLEYPEQKSPQVRLEIPAELITGKSKEINYDLIKGKTIIGLCGYAGAGKDEIGKPLVNRLGFKRISFGDAIKSLMDKHMKVQTYEDLQRRGVELPFEEVNQLNPKDRVVKEMLRPYLKWFGEEMKRLNGIHHWTNIAFENIGDTKKVVITDVRRMNEVEIFENSTQYFQKIFINLSNVSVDDWSITKYNQNTRGYESMLLHINQRGLKDDDVLTHETIRDCFEKWLFDDIIYIDSKIPNKNNFRENHILNHIHTLVKKYPSFFV